MDDKRNKVSKENDLLKAHQVEFEKEKLACQRENDVARTEMQHLESEQKELLKRVDELKDAQRVLQLK